MFTVEERYGFAARTREPFSDAQTPSTYVPVRYEGGHTIGTYRTIRGARTVLTRTVNEIKASRSENGVSRVLHVDNRLDSCTVFYRDRITDMLRFYTVRIVKS